VVGLGMIEQLPPPAPGIITVTVSGKLWHEGFNNTLPLIEAAGASQRTQHLAWELININAVCPGGVLTPLIEQHTTPQFKHTTAKRPIPLSPLCTVDEIGDAEDFMARGRGMITGRMTAVNTKGAAA
jgi:hypothetical protein